MNLCLGSAEQGGFLVAALRWSEQMSLILEAFLLDWSKPYIRDQDFKSFFKRNDRKRYDALRYAIKTGVLLKLRRGLYLINRPSARAKIDLYELANIIFGPSYLSLESALSYHGWIPESVLWLTSVTIKRKRKFETPLTHFVYEHVPTKHFMAHVQRVETKTGAYLVASPWKAIADHLYVYKRSWQSINDLSVDMRIEMDYLLESDFHVLNDLAHSYKSVRVRKTLQGFNEELRQ